MNDKNNLKLVRVTFDEDIGLVSMALGEVLAHAYDIRGEWCDGANSETGGFPTIDILDSDFKLLAAPGDDSEDTISYMDDANWDNVVALLRHPDFQKAHPELSAYLSLPSRFTPEQAEKIRERAMESVMDDMDSLDGLRTWAGHVVESMDAGGHLDVLDLPNRDEDSRWSVIGDLGFDPESGLPDPYSIDDADELKRFAAEHGVELPPDPVEEGSEDDLDWPAWARDAQDALRDWIERTYYGGDAAEGQEEQEDRHA